jgi:hypothetical protein
VSIEYTEGKLLSHTGAPGERSCAQTGCHVNATQSKTVALDLMDGLEGYTAGKSHLLQLALNDAAWLNTGFQLTALDENGRSVGTLEAVNEGSVVNGTESFPARAYFSHMPEGLQGSNNYFVKWNAPTAYSGAVTFYVAGVAANMDGNGLNDRAFETSLTVLPQDDGPHQLKNSSFTVYPSFVNSFFELSFMLPAERSISVSLVDYAGRIQQHWQTDLLSQGNHQLQFETGGDLAPGVYLLHVEGLTELATAKLVISR